MIAAGSRSCRARLARYRKHEYKQGVTIGLAERVGFEPTVRCDTYTCFPSKRLRPLGHLSGCGGQGSVAQVRAGFQSIGRGIAAGSRFYKAAPTVRPVAAPTSGLRTGKVSRVRVGSPATISRKPRQARKGATVAARSGAGVGLTRIFSFQQRVLRA